MPVVTKRPVRPSAWEVVEVPGKDESYFIETMEQLVGWMGKGQGGDQFFFLDDSSTELPNCLPFLALNWIVFFFFNRSDCGPR